MNRALGEEITIRRADSGDIAALTQIYNHYIIETHITFHTEPFAIGARTQWFTQFSETGPYRLLVGEVDGTVIGYASSTPFKARPAYRTSVETTVYLHPDHTGHGHGMRLLGALLDELAATDGVHRAYGGVALPNPASAALHESLGYKHVATYSEVGYKFDRFWDVIWYEKEL